MSVVPVTVAGVADTVVPYPVVVPYSKVTVVPSLFAFIVPFRVAPVVLIPPAALVVTAGAAPPVVKVISAPFVAPVVFTPVTL